MSDKERGIHPDAPQVTVKTNTDREWGSPIDYSQSRAPLVVVDTDPEVGEADEWDELLERRNQSVLQPNNLDKKPTLVVVKVDTADDDDSWGD